MKKLLLFFLGISLFLSCSTDDNKGGDQVDLGELIVTIANEEIFIGEQVLISVTDAKGAKVEGARIFVNNEQVNALYQFSKAGKFSVIAKKAGYRDSKGREVQVKGLEIITLSVQKKEVKVGDQITFSIAAGNNVPTTEIKIYHVETGEELKSNTYTAQESGDYSFIAKGKGFNDSNVVTIKVIPEVNYFTIGSKTFLTTEVGFEMVQKKYSKGIYDKVRLYKGKAVNELEINVMNITEEGEVNLLQLTVLIPNPTIKLNEKNAIVDFGKRVTLDNASDWILDQVYFAIAGQGSQILEVQDEEFKDIQLSTSNISIPNDGVGAGKKGVLGNGNLEFSASGELKLQIGHKGEFKFSERTNIF